mgnify:CR=1 FL=1
MEDSLKLEVVVENRTSVPLRAIMVFALSGRMDLEGAFAACVAAGEP